jgi:hypothetical protein
MTTSPVTTITDELLAEIEAAANAVKGWQCGQAFQVVEEGHLPSEWYWHVGRVDEEDNQYPVLLVDTAQYDQPEQAECVAHYYAAVSRDTVLAMAAELRTLRAERAELVETMRDISRQIDGNIRPTVRDCINGMPDHNDIYDYCDAIEAAIDAAIQEQAQ